MWQPKHICSPSPKTKTPLLRDSTLIPNASKLQLKRLLLSDKGWSDSQGHSLTFPVQSRKLGQGLWGKNYIIEKYARVFLSTQCSRQGFISQWLPPEIFRFSVLRTERRCHHHWGFNRHTEKFKFANPETRAPELWFFLKERAFE